MVKLRFIDAHGFAGGFTVGAVQAGLELVAKREDPSAFGTSLLEANRAFLGNQWQAQAAPAAEWEPVAADVVIGTPPCTGFSGMSVGAKSRGIDAEINHCMWDLIQYAAKVRPAVLVMESVAQAYTNGLSLMRRLTERLNELTGLRYHATHVLQNNLSTGGCTMRRRYFLVLSQVPFGVEVPELVKLPTIADAIGDLMGLRLQWDPQAYTDSSSYWNDRMRSSSGIVDGHMTEDHDLITCLRDEVVDGPMGVGWLPGDDINGTLKRYYDTHGRLPERWNRPYKGRKPESIGGTLEAHVVAKNFDTGGFSRPRYWRWDRPGYVITGAGFWGTWHPTSRLYTHREVARVMGFPDDWIVGDVKTDRRLCSYWGKGTSVHPAKWIMDWVRDSIHGNPGSVTGTVLDQGDRIIDVSNTWRPVARAQFGTTVFGRVDELKPVAV